MLEKQDMRRLTDPTLSQHSALALQFPPPRSVPPPLARLVGTAVAIAASATVKKTEVLMNMRLVERVHRDN